MNFKILKKVPFALLTVLGTQTINASTPAPFNGFYAGALAGIVRNNLKGEINILTFKAKKTQHITGFLYGLMAGYGCNFNGFYLGAEIGVQSDTTNKNKSYKYTIVGVDGEMKAKYQRGPVLSIGPRIGVIFGGSYMAYFKPALEISKDKTIITDDDGDTCSSKKKLQCAFVPTVGLEKAFSSVLIRVEYGYNLGANSKLTFKDEGFSVSHSLKYTSHVVKFGVAYQF